MNTFNICGFQFYVTWSGNEGVDQHGRIWHNPSNPTPKDKGFIDLLLDNYNIILNHTV